MRRSPTAPRSTSYRPSPAAEVAAHGHGAAYPETTAAAEIPVPLSAIVVAGGRSSRLGGSPKALMRPQPRGARTLVESAVCSLLELGAPAERIAVVGPAELPLPDGVLRTREDPPFSGPVSALAAGASALGLASSVGGWTLTLACDMPRCGDVARALIDAIRASGHGAADPSSLPHEAGPESDPTAGSPSSSERPRGIVLRDRDILQPLAAAYRSSELGQQLASQPIVDRSVRRVLGPLWDRQLPVRGLTEDVDTWDDVKRFGLLPAED